MHHEHFTHPIKYLCFYSASQSSNTANIWFHNCMYYSYMPAYMFIFINVKGINITGSGRGLVVRVLDSGL